MHSRRIPVAPSSFTYLKISFVVQMEKVDEQVSLLWICRKSRRFSFRWSALDRGQGWDMPTLQSQLDHVTTA